jgi:hypothetical protein
MAVGRTWAEDFARHVGCTEDARVQARAVYNMLKLKQQWA